MSGTKSHQGDGVREIDNIDRNRETERGTYRKRERDRDIHRQTMKQKETDAE